MLTVVSENTYGNYDEMTLAEACAQMQIDTSDIVHEMQMDILLDEHAFLLENGYEIDYVNEGAREMGEKIMDGLRKAGASIAKLWDKLMYFIDRKVDEVNRAFHGIGIDRRRILAILDKYDSAHYLEDITGVRFAVTDFKKFSSDAKSGAFFLGADEAKSSEARTNQKMINNDQGRLVFLSSYAESNTRLKMDHDTVREAIKFLFEDKNTVLADIRSAKNATNRAIKEAMVQVQRKLTHGNIGKTEETRKEYNTLLENMSIFIKVNSAVAKEAVKLYHAHMANCVVVLKKFVKSGWYKDNAKEDGVKNRMNQIKSADKKDKAYDKKHPTKYAPAKVKGFKVDAPNEKTPKKEEVREFAVYDGRFFNV